MRLVVDGETFEGRAIDVRGTVTSETVANAIAGDARDGVSIDAPRPGPAHATLGVVPATATRRELLAAAARSHGDASPYDRELATAERRLRELSVPAVDVAGARKRVADAGQEQEALRERVATLRGRLVARRETGAETADVEAELEDATRRLSEIETQRVAAEQALDRARERARVARETRERRLELQDHVGNLRRRAREHLAGEVREAVSDAVDAVPGGDPGPEAGPLAVDDHTLHLAALRVATLEAPVVVTSDRFESAGDAADLLDAPVIRARVQTG